MDLDIEWCRPQTTAQSLKPFFTGTENGNSAPGLGPESGQTGFLQPFPKLARFFSGFARVRHFASRVGSQLRGLQVETHHLSGQNLRPRIELDECDLLVAVVEDFPERFVHEIELGGIEPERDRKLERLGRARFNQRLMDPPIFRKISAVAIDRLLKIADHTKVPGAWMMGFVLEPIARRGGRAG